jgi:heptosyltransferase-1
MASPLIKGIKAAFPDSRLSWLVEPSGSGLLEAHPLLDGLLYWNKQEWQRLMRQKRWTLLARRVHRFMKELQAQNFDLVLDAQGLFRTRLMAFATRAEHRIGFRSREPGRFFMTRLVAKGSGDKQMGSEYGLLMQQIGAGFETLQPDIRLSGAAIARAANRLKEEGLSPAEPFIAFCPFTTRAQKHWPEQRWAHLAGELAADSGWPILLLGGREDAPAAARIQAAGSGRVASFCGRTTLAEAAAVVRAACLVVGVDTGLTHLASAFSRPCIALFGATRPYLHTAGGSTRVLYHARDCSPCRRRPTCGQKYDCMREHGVRGVRDAALELLARGAGPEESRESA